MTRTSLLIGMGLLLALGCGEKKDGAAGGKDTQGTAEGGDSKTAGAAADAAAGKAAPTPVAPEPAGDGDDGDDGDDAKPSDSVLEKLAVGTSRDVDLDGDGKTEAIKVSKDNVAVGSTKIATADDSKVFLLDLNPDKPKQQVLVSQFTEEDTVESTVYEYKKGKLVAAGSVYGSSEPTARDGLLVVTRWTCEQRNNRALSADVTQGWALRKGKLVKLSEKKGKEKDIGDYCPACPFVYVDVAGDWRRAGEILRYLSDPSLETTQRLRLPTAAVRDNTVRVKLAEEKREITFLDDVYLEVDGQIVAPDRCEFCGRGDDRRRLAEGDSLTLEFTLPSGAAPRSLALVARGYYVHVR